MTFRPETGAGSGQSLPGTNCVATSACSGSTGRPLQGPGEQTRRERIKHQRVDRI